MSFFLSQAFQTKALGIEDNMKQLHKEWQLKESKLDISDAKGNKLRLQMEELDEQWTSVKKNAEDYHQMLNEKIVKWSELEDRNRNLYDQLQYLMVNFEGADKAPIARQRVIFYYCF